MVLLRLIERAGREVEEMIGAIPKPRIGRIAPEVPSRYLCCRIWLTGSTLVSVGKSSTI